MWQNGINYAIAVVDALKWYGIINKVVFWDGKMGWDGISGCGCSYTSFLV